MPIKKPKPPAPKKGGWHKPLKPLKPLGPPQLPKLPKP
jgi:hypothetical protein